MEKLKLNQLNKQKVAEREMSVIEGGLPAKYENWDAVESCSSSCSDSQFMHHPSHDMHSSFQSGLAF